MSAGGNKVLLVLTVLGALAAATTGFVAEAPNRLLSGRPILFWHAPEGVAIGLVVLLGALFGAALLPQRPAIHWGTVAAAAVLILLLPLGAGATAARLALHARPAARTLLGPAFWILWLAAALAIVDGLQRLRAGPGLRALVALLLAATILLMARAGWFDALSLAREYAARRGAFAAALGQHVTLVAAALVPAVLIGVPLGLAAARRPRLKAPIFAVLNMLQTIPSVALLGLLITPLASLAAAVPALAALGVSGVGFTPAVIALVLYALLPVVRSTEAGVAGLDPVIAEAAAGMGLTPAQILLRVTLPLGLPVFLAGLRIVIVQAIGLAVIAALVGAGGFGTFVFQGLGQYAVDLVLLGALPTILLALAADLALGILITLSERRRLR